MNRTFKCLLIAVLAGFICTTIVWQFAEVRVNSTLEAIWYRISKNPINHHLALDSNGVPIQYLQAHTPQYNPLFIARYAQQSYLEKDNPNKLKAFLATTDWLVDNAVKTDSTLINYYTFDYDSFQMKAPWASALAQAVIMNVLRNRSELMADSLYFDYSKKALNSLLPSYSNLTYEDETGELWFMEYPAEKPYYVLNGMISVLLELSDYYKATGDTVASCLFDRGYDTLVEKLPQFDYKGFSYYDLSGSLAGRLYHQKHIRQLLDLSNVRAHPILTQYHKKWRQTDMMPVPLQFIWNPRPRRIIAFILVWMIISDIAFGLMFIGSILQRSRSDKYGVT